MAHQSLYRRYRPQRFSEVRGQDHVVGALRSAVAENRVGHAYLFSGPRGTGKTSTARILAKALNCENLVDGEPDGTCEACLAMQAGTSYDLQELDAASNNKVEDVRTLIERVALGSPGRTKVYILDEVHMLSTGASNALLKTLEEPPDHVVFVLATTDPQKVLPTIRSRTQHFEFHLLPAEELADHVRWVISDAGLDVDDAAVEHVLRAGGGSARDTLSALDQAAAGGVSTDGDHAEALAEAVVARETAAALTAVATATIAGRDPRVLGEALLAHLRDVFLHRMGGPLGHLSDTAAARVAGWADRVTDRSVTRALEEVGEALLAMRQAPDPRIPLEVALVRITGPGASGGAGAGDAPAGGPALDDLIARVARLEAAAAGGGSARSVDPVATAPAPPAPEAAPTAPPAGDAPPTAPVEPTAPAAPPTGGSGRGADIARAALAAKGVAPPPSRPRPAASSSPPPPPPARTAAPPPAEPVPSEPAPAEPVPAAEAPVAEAPAAPAPPPVPDDAEPVAPPLEPAAAAPAVEAPAEEPAPGPAGADVVRAWTDDVVPALRGIGKALFTAAVVVGADDGSLTVGLSNQATVERAGQKQGDAEAALAAAVGRPVRLVLVVGDDDRAAPGAPAATPTARAPQDEAIEEIDLDSLVDAPTEVRSGIDRVTDAFPGAQVVDP